MCESFFADRLEGYTVAHRSEHKEVAEATDREPALILLNARGTIEFCGNPSPELEALGEMQGKSVRTLLPSLPLREQTPGYNVAYVRVAFAENHWQRHTVLLPDGSLRPVEICLRVVQVNQQHCLVGLLRPTAAAEKPALPMRTFQFRTPAREDNPAAWLPVLAANRSPRNGRNLLSAA